MEKVTIYKLQPDGSQQSLAECILDGGEVKCSGDQQFVAKLVNEGISNYQSSGSEKLYPKDGKLFLEQLKFNFASGYISATDVTSQ